MKRSNIKYLLLVFLITALTFQGCIIIQTPVIYEEAKKGVPYDVIIVPGVPYKDAGMADIMNFRVRWAKHLYEEGIAKNVIFSGGAVYTPYVEGKIMALMGEEIGIPAEHIFVEDKAEHSTENMYYGYLLAKKLGFNRIAVASDQYQSFMLHEVYERFKLYDLEFVPMKVSFMREVDKTPIAINPESAKVKNFVALTERQSFADRFKGTRGKYVQEQIRLTEERQSGTR
ncbi:MAG: YdcF family protein [Flavobacteriales bacterium]|nr:YdcF family protein [Flavobacteriales bacterium]